MASVDGLTCDSSATETKVNGFIPVPSTPPITKEEIDQDLLSAGSTPELEESTKPETLTVSLSKKGFGDKDENETSKNPEEEDSISKQEVTTQNDVKSKESSQTEATGNDMASTDQPVADISPGSKSPTGASPLERFNQAWSLLSSSSGIGLPKGQPPSPLLFVTPPSDSTSSPQTNLQWLPLERRHSSGSPTARPLFLSSPPSPHGSQALSTNRLKERMDTEKTKIVNPVKGAEVCKECLRAYTSPIFTEHRNIDSPLQKIHSSLTPPLTSGKSNLLESVTSAGVASDSKLTNDASQMTNSLSHEVLSEEPSMNDKTEAQVVQDDGDTHVVDMNKSEDEYSSDDTSDTGEKSLATFFVGNDSTPASRQNSCPGESAPLTKHENGNAGLEGEVSDSEQVTMRHGRKSQVSLLLGSLFMILSGLYGILIVVLGAVIPLTEIFVKEDGTAFEAFYIYLYSVSIIFLCYVYVYLLRRNRLPTEFLTKTLSRSISFTRSWASSWARGTSDRSRQRKRMVSLDESNHHTGTFYLRLGVLGFGIGSMIHSGLNFGKFFGSITEGQCSNGVSLLLKPLLHLIFTFSQLYFIFMNSKMCIHRKKVLARFGLMHMAATNICVWFRSIVVETLHEIHHHHEHVHDDHHGDGHMTGHDPDQIANHMTMHGAATYNSLTAEPENITMSFGRKLLAAAVSNGNGSDDHNEGGLLELRCAWNNMMGKAVDSAGPYLYPCTIEYSLMCAGILYVMWSNVGTRPRFRTNSEMEDVEEDLKHQRMSVDCTSSSRGLFLGIFLTVSAIISIIAFYVMVSQPHLKSEALLLTHLSETLIYCVTTFALIMAALKMRNLVFHSDHKSDLEETLIIIAYTGLLAFNIFSLIAAILMAPAEGAALTIISNFTMMLQSALQTIFMLAGDRMSAGNAIQERKKPGREYVTFLLLCNFAMWVINTFETQKPEHNPLQVKFYGPEAWSIFSHISVPLGIYYRFHSTVCFSNIWKNAWKMRKHH